MYIAASLLSWNHIHPVLVHFPTALLPASLISDVVGKYFNRKTLTAAAWWMALYAAIATPITVVAGWMWAAQFPPSAAESLHGLEVHKWLGISLAMVFAVLTVWRGRSFAVSKGPGAVYLLITGLAVGALMYQGFLGGQMTIG
jgi:uncharacterized membrane protein